MLGTDRQLSLSEKYSNPSYWWATEPMAQQAWSQFRHEQEAAVISYIETLNNDPAARGRVFEEVVHHLIEVAGIQGPLRNLQTGEVTNFGIPLSSSSFFKSFKDINSSSEYWRPVSKIHKTCDAYKPSEGLMLQMTIGVSHQINICGLEDILKSGIFDEWIKQHPNEKLRMIFIVHPSVYKEFTKQTYTYNHVAEEGNSKDNSEKRQRNTEKRKAAAESKVTQYVI